MKVPPKKKILTGDGMEAVAAMVATAPSALEEDYDSTLNGNRPVLWSSGCTTLNMALSDHPYEAWAVGRMANIIGDSSSGKTFLALTALAEAANDPRFADYDLVFDDIEEANTFDIPQLFGKKAAARICKPIGEGDSARNTGTIEEWYGGILRRIASRRPFIYITDSVDAMTTAEDVARAAAYVKQINAPAKVKRGKTADDSVAEEDSTDDAPANRGSYKVEKAKLLSEMLRTVVGGLAETGSSLFLISQVRVNLDPRTSRFSPKIRTGGAALKFYATYEMWLSHLSNITHAATKRKIGDECLVKVTKNKVIGKQRAASFPLYYNYGIDDISSCLTFLITSGAVSVVGRTVEAEALLGRSGTREALLAHYEADPAALRHLRETVGKVWLDIEDKIQVKRVPKYE